MSKQLIIIILLICSVTNCTNRPTALQEALEANPALQTVIDRYSAPADSQKLRAARFLIENLSAHTSYSGEGLERYYDVIDSVSAKYADRDDVEARQAFKELENRNFGKPRKTSDLKAVTPEYLIQNIEAAFTLREKSHWTKDLSFSDFCEYLLPYKVGECQTLDNWREYLADNSFGDLSKLYITSNQTVRAAEK